MEQVVANRFILRAEIRSSDETVICYGFDLTPEAVFVVTDWHAPAGTRVALRLSFPNILEPIDLEARVDDVRASGGPGEVGGMRLAFSDSSELGRARVASFLERLSAAAFPVRASDRTFRVLLVEDSGFIRDMFAYGISRFSEQPGTFVIDHAEDAERAWHKLGESKYDLVIVDYFLPTADGASLIARLRRDERLSQLPVVAISVGGRDAREATISAGADLFLDKPLVFRDLFHTLRILSQREDARRSGDRKSILVFDDSPMVLALTRAALESAGFDVAVAEDLSSFEQQRVSFDPDLILVDVQMPEAFGDDVASTLRGLHGVRVPILLVSSIEEDELASRARHAAAGYISKAAGIPALIRRCKELLEGAA